MPYPNTNLMKFYFLCLMLFGCCTLFGQDGYYFKTVGDTVYCQFKKVFPGFIKVKTKEQKNLWLTADEIKGFTKDGIPFVSKKILNPKKDPYIFLPNDKMDRQYKFSDPNLAMISGNGITFYELVEFGGVSAHTYGRSSTISLYIENDSLGLSKVPQMKLIGGADQMEVTNVLHNYLKSNKAIEKKLNSMKNWNTINYKEIRKLIEEFTGKEFVD